MTLAKKLFLLAMLVVAAITPCSAKTPAAAQQANTPLPGTAERTRILDAIRESAGLDIRFIVHSLRVAKGTSAQYAHAVVEPSKQEYDGGEFLLKYEGKWRVVWSVNGGGTSDCRRAAIYYQSALRTLEADGIEPDILDPQLSEQYQNLATFALEDPDCNTIGDLGPELTSVAALQSCKTCVVPDVPFSFLLDTPVSRILSDPRLPAPITKADLDGDTRPDEITIVQIMPSAPGRIIDQDLVFANPWDTDLSAQPLPEEGTQMALLIRNSASGKRYLLHSPYVELSNNLRPGGPVDVTRAKSSLAAAFRKDCPTLRNDMLVMSTEAGIDIALFWDGRAKAYDVCWPNEIP